MSGALISRERLLEVYGSLETMHAWRGWHWWPDADPFEVIVGAILVQNTAWTNVERALSRLREADVLAPAAMAALADSTLEELVRPSGQYRQKARKLRAFLALSEASGGLDQLLALPPDELRRVLLATWGIGPETADCVVVYAARQPAFVVDAYTARVFSRLGLGPGETAGYDAWQALFTTHLEPDRDFWARYHALVVMHAKHLCRKSRPLCSECSLRDVCLWPGAAG